MYVCAHMAMFSILVQPINLKSEKFRYVWMPPPE